jgi:branched-chain amino acid transport system permease protein
MRVPLLAVAVVAALASGGAVAPIGWVFLASELLIAILFAASLNLLMGYGGMLSFGHAAYYAIAAYTSALLVTNANWPVAAAMAAGPVAAALGALLFGFFIVRANRGEHASFLMLTLAFSQLVFAMLYKWYELTHGDDGISGLFPNGWLGDPRHYFWFVLGVVAVCLWLLRRIVSSPFGITLQSMRDNRTRAAFLGLSVWRTQLLAFVIAGTFAGVAGTLFAFFSGTVSPQMADWTASARPFLSDIIGGVESFWGPVWGVLLLELVDSQAARLTEHSLLAVGVLAIVVGLAMPRGIAGTWRR